MIQVTGVLVLAAGAAFALIRFFGEAPPLPGALVLIPLSFISFALVTLPLLIPAFLMFRTYARAAPKGSSGRAAVTTAAVLAFFVAAFIVLFTGRDAREYVTATAVYGTSDIVTYAEAAQSLALTTTGTALGWWAAAERIRPARAR